MRSGVVAILVGAGLSCACDEAFAADANRINISGVVTETYDSNISRSNAAVAAARGVTPGDSITAPAITVDIRVPVSRQSVFLKGSVGYNFYARNTILNSADINLLGGVELLVRNCKGTLSGDISYEQSDLQQLSLAVTKNINDTRSVSLAGSCGPAVGFAPTLSLTQTWSDNSSPELRSQNYGDFDVTAGLAYRRPLFGELSAYFSYDDTTYAETNLPALALVLQNGYRNYAAGIRYDRRFGARIEGDIKVGYTSVQPTARTVPGFEGPTFGGDLTFRFSRLLQAQLSFSRAVNPQNQAGVTYGIDNTVSGSISYSVGRKLSLAAGASGESNSYRGRPLFIVVNQAVTSERIWDVFASAKYQLNRRIGFGLDYTHEQRDANPAAFSYTDDRIGLSISGRI
jgi:hypothetical protein